MTTLTNIRKEARNHWFRKAARPIIGVALLPLVLLLLVVATVGHSVQLLVDRHTAPIHRQENHREIQES